MINTSAFESLERYNRLLKARNSIRSKLVPSPTCIIPHPYRWMIKYLDFAIEREREFMEQCKNAWIEGELK